MHLHILKKFLFILKPKEGEKLNQFENHNFQRRIQNPINI